MRTPTSPRAHVLGCVVVLLIAGGVVSSTQSPATSTGAPPDTPPTATLDVADRAFLDTRYRDATEAYRLARDHKETAANPSLLRRASLGLIRSMLRVTRFADARKDAIGFVAAHPADADAMTLDGETLFGLGLFPEAEIRFNEALKRDPQDVYAHHGLARVLAAQRKFEAALAHVNEAILRTPKEVEPRFTRAFILDRLHHYDEAAQALRDAMTLFPPNEKSDRVILTRSQIKFFENFRGKTPFEIDPRAVDQIHTVPFRIVRDKVIVRGKVNGGQPIDLVLDTGAEMTVLARRTAAQHGVMPTGYTVSAGVGERGVRGLQVGRMDQLVIGTYKVKHIPVLIKNPALVGIPRSEADAFSPLSLGLSMTIDYKRKLLTFGRSVHPKGEIELPLYSYRLAVVRGTINDRTPATFVVDTGGEVISISSSMAAMLEPPRARRIPLKVWGSSGWDRDAVLWPGLDLAFDRIRYENFSTVVLNLRAPSALLGFELGGIVGHRFLSQYDVGMDLERNVLTLTPTTPAAPRVSASPRVVPGDAGSLPLPSAALRLSRE